jgi:hypothetical protein
MRQQSMRDTVLLELEDKSEWRIRPCHEPSAIIQKGPTSERKGRSESLLRWLLLLDGGLGYKTTSNDNVCSGGMAAALNNTLVSEQIDTSVWRSTPRPLGGAAAVWRKSNPV